MSNHEPFYGKVIDRDAETEIIKSVVAKYKNEKVDDELKKKVWNELQHLRHIGTLSIPFKLAVTKDPTGKFPEFIEVIVDTKV